jgi:acetyl-CoA synthetase
MSDGAATDGTLERELDAMLSIERFEPPAGFRADALLSDPAIYEEAARDPQAWWARQAEQLDWFERWDTVLDDSDPPFYKWFTGGKLNATTGTARRGRRATSRTPSCTATCSASRTR